MDLCVVCVWKKWLLFFFVITLPLACVYVFCFIDYAVKNILRYVLKYVGTSKSKLKVFGNNIWKCVVYLQGNGDSPSVYFICGRDV